MTESESPKPEDVLNEILEGLQSADDASRLNAIEKLRSLNYSSEAIRAELERMAIHDASEDVRREALAALDTATQKHVRSRLNKLETNSRLIVLNEINEWEKRGLLDETRASVLRKRYDFDRAPAAAPFDYAQGEGRPAPVQAAPFDYAQGEPQPAGPRPTLMQTLLSETSIKIALYLGAFFVIASAAILAAVSPELRLFVLITASIGFGGLSLGIRRRLPHPSFALFIVFSFVLLITANVLEESLDLAPVPGAIYWVIVMLFMTVMWGGSAWLYESRVFSVTSFLAFVLALHRMGDVFDAEPELYLTLDGLAVLAGLIGAWILKKWKDSKFALPLFFTAQIAQAVILGASLIAFGENFLNESGNPLWNTASIFTWGAGFIFYVLSDLLFAFFAFPWLAAATLVTLPWFTGAAFEMQETGMALLCFAWGLILSIVSEAGFRFEATRKFSLAILLVSIPTFALGLINAFGESAALGFMAALGVACVYAALHLLRARGWLWALALFSFSIAYFAFFDLPLIEKADIGPGYQSLGLSVIFLLPGLFFKNDLKTHAAWRLPPLLYGAFFTFLATTSFIVDETPFHAAIGFAIFAAFFTVYAAAQRRAAYGYLPAFFMALAVIFALDHLERDWWMTALTALAVLYYLLGAASHLLKIESWPRTLRNSGLILGSLVSLTALFMLKETGGWYALAIGLMFAAEMYLSKNGWFEIGLPLLFNLGAFLILRDFDISGATNHLVIYSGVWLGADMLAHLTFAHPRPLSIITRGIGGMLTLVNYGLIFLIADRHTGALDFGLYTLLILTVNLVYRRARLFHSFTLTLPLFTIFLFRHFDITQWIHPVIVVAMIFYAAGFFLRRQKRAQGWDEVLLYGGLGWGVIVSVAAPVLGGVDAAIPVAIAATLWAIEAFARKNVWLGFPANGTYLLAYFILLIELNVDQPQFFSMGAALLGLFQHYLLTRAGSKTGTFIMGMLSQLVLLLTTYIQMVSTEELIYFVVLFLQALAVLVYGIVIRSRSLTFTPIALVVLGVVTVLYTALKGLNTVVLIGCTGIILLGLGIAAVLMRERIAKIGERLGEWGS